MSSASSELPAISIVIGQYINKDREEHSMSTERIVDLKLKLIETVTQQRQSHPKLTLLFRFGCKHSKTVGNNQKSGPQKKTSIGNFHFVFLSLFIDVCLAMCA